MKCLEKVAMDDLIEKESIVVFNHYITAPSSARCADGYKEYNNKCWKLFMDNPISWYDARTTCQMENGELATINSQEEMDFVYSEILQCCSMYYSLYVYMYMQNREG